MNAFADIYTVDLINERTKPLRTEELKQLGLSEQDIAVYLNLMKSLYTECLLNNMRPALQPDWKCSLYDNCTHERFADLLSFLLVHHVIDMTCYDEIIKENVPEVTLYRYFDFSTELRIDSIEDYRLSMERFFAGIYDYSRDEAQYLMDRYGFGITIKEEAKEKRFFEQSDLFIYNCERLVSKSSFTKISYWEALSLLKRIRHDLSENEKLIRISDNNPPINRKPIFGDNTLTKPSLDIAAWFDNRKRLDREREWLELCESEIDEIIESDDEYKTSKSSGDTLFIYKGRICCHNQKHEIIPATAVLYGKKDEIIELNVEYCTVCKRYMLEYTAFDEYRNRYGAIIGNLRMIATGQFNGEYDLALESPLRLSGYSVNQNDGFTSNERHYILARIIHDKIMSKSEVIRYLTYFINMNGAKVGNEIALDKWREDLDFVQEYDIETQPKMIISEVKKYRR